MTLQKRFVRNYNYKGHEEIIIIHAENETEAESECYFIEQDITMGDTDSDFEWLGPVCDIKTYIQTMEKEMNEKCINDLCHIGNGCIHEKEHTQK